MLVDRRTERVKLAFVYSSTREKKKEKKKENKEEKTFENALEQCYYRTHRDYYSLLSILPRSTHRRRKPSFTTGRT